MLDRIFKELERWEKVPKRREPFTVEMLMAMQNKCFVAVLYTLLLLAHSAQVAHDLAYAVLADHSGSRLILFPVVFRPLATTVSCQTTLVF